ncbi:MAG: hypothetical protein WC428_01940 [Candidatus Paceibacterota bacterium]
MSRNSESQIYNLSFQTDLNESMRVKIEARSYKSAVKKLIKEYPSAFDID